MTENPEPRFWELVNETYAAIEALDNFDPDGSDAHFQHLDGLLHSADVWGRRLVDHCIENAASLRKAFPRK